MIACINTCDSDGAPPLLGNRGTSGADKVRHITLFAARRLNTPIKPPLKQPLRIQFAETAFTPTIKINTCQ